MSDSFATRDQLVVNGKTLTIHSLAKLGQRVLVQGNPVYLAQPPVVAEVRATLLAALRAAVLWRQLGGTYWDFLFARGRLANEAKQLLG
jgi:high frequency lysogenization protein